MRRRTDEGFTLIETMVALAVVGVVMSALALFFIRSSTVQHRQADVQVAAQLAANSLDYVSQLPGENVLLGRDQIAVQAQWQAPGTSVYLDPARTELAWQDPSTPASATVAGLPTAPETIQPADGATPYQRWWYVGRCWQPKTGGDCVVVPAVPALLRSSRVEMFRIVVALTWTAPDCANRQCQYVTAMLAESSLDDPIW
ncbi:type II secretion system protein [Paractinoplanes lichenicola]|uniref:Type II secretion system protein n=1 Tax=Paractinoplanes lichenicola TaxID=2802976 RepID=A0ABM8NCV6_9ACTN|nr:type II secretion system protein [Actinoplanes lichenicola]MBL7253176.1 type II secretion system protein [Actinoplanes lichenicola]